MKTSASSRVPAMPDGVADAALRVDDVLLRDGVEHLAVGGDHHGAGHLVHPLHVARR